MSTDEISVDEREELDWLRRENRLLRVERDILLKIATEYTLERAEPPRR
ncbi:hypothetical protein A8924_5809 [Saccharopolyspora erythraea NRRL 2338]|uniref:Uncharacterized protein n=2 Tax=Saccharopolyspora erythraea TaxID=1836 RepID=A4FKT8_SACEN|nr:hypothetical protein [Saccharopolyspora erythraea]EQD81478.1 hypothetical protein N599_35985 [Saccharopolyspora erythraea D]PFG98301.1 hypothetical protein A8924_5809 [Saccharopolyspora erythraea NRRL 2338]QRK88387.1 hypothetical protein JQX30_27455 [Saccharopolyspora erythraea]CAM04663.1 hypothetical protein SACE_5428 [Saccharopolyspora erythraea NRRL 2338]